MERHSDLVYCLKKISKLLLNLPQPRKLIILIILIIGIVVVLAIQLQQLDSIKSMVTPGALITLHAKLDKDCAKCHHAFKEMNQNNLCLDCHKEVAQDLKDSQRFHGINSIVKEKQCKSCHTDHKGREFDIIHLDKETFNHSLTDFPLVDAHAGGTCEACHLPGKKYRAAPKDCLSCHVNNDKHKGQLGTNCVICHKQTFWKDAYLDHKKTKFPLEGKHQQVTCNGCHVNKEYKNTPIDCICCHLINDIHATPSGQNCQQCHGVQGWRKVSYDHNQKTKFILKGRHAELKCNACHPGNLLFNKNKQEAACVDCHSADDVHKGKNGANCESCHSAVNWKQVTFDHSKDSKFKILGRHIGLQCAACHTDKSGKMKIGIACNLCHKKNDVHKSQQGEKCELCHSENGWKEKIQFDHDLTDFPLIGLHAVISCGECHLSSAFKDADTKCISCHQLNDYHKATLGPNCEKCHNPNGWKLWEFDHNIQTKYKLEGAHEGLQCQVCHQIPMSKNVQLSSNCFSCHDNEDIHNGRYGLQCERCHSVESFKKIIWEDNK